MIGYKMTMRTAMITIVLMQASLARADGPKKLPTPSKIERAKLTVKKYAFEAYPEWAAAHPDTACPAKIEALQKFLTKADTKDPWGHGYKMSCGKDLPPGVRGLAVLSLGPDGKVGTRDDIKSWE